MYVYLVRSSLSTHTSPTAGVGVVGGVAAYVKLLIATPSIVTRPALERAKVVSVACPNSTEPTPIAVEVEATRPAIGSPVQLVRVPLVGVPRRGVTRVGVSAKTRAPEPVSSVITDFRLAELEVVRKVRIAELRSARAAVPEPVK